MLERSDKGAAAREMKQFGYQSIHFIVRLKSPRADLPEYRGMKGMVCEIQLRTIVQHAWAEIEHNIKFRSHGSLLLTGANRRIEAIAGTLEMVDREFQLINDEHEALVEQTRQAIHASLAAPSAGVPLSATVPMLEEIPITGSTVRTLVEEAMGADKQVHSDSWMWDWLARLAVSLGHKNIAELAAMTRTFDWAVGAAAHWDVRPAAPIVFEEMMLQFDPDRFVDRHALARNDEYMRGVRARAERVKVELARRRTAAVPLTV